MDCTLLCDGSSDRMLIPAIKWLLVEHFPELAFNFEHADIRRFSNKKLTLSERICLALDLFPCEILFVHRDAEKDSYEMREAEIQKAIEHAICELPDVLPVVPIRMSEAWLLIDEDAIRAASGNPNGTMPLDLPPIKSLETIIDPKELLIDKLKLATGLNRRRLKRFNPSSAIHNLAEMIEDFSQLRSLSAFSRLEEIIKRLDL